MTEQRRNMNNIVNTFDSPVEGSLFGHIYDNDKVDLGQIWLDGIGFSNFHDGRISPYNYSDRKTDAEDLDESPKANLAEATCE
jgi:hypothetical protein